MKNEFFHFNNLWIGISLLTISLLANNGLAQVEQQISPQVADQVANHLSEPVDWPALQTRLQGIYERGQWRAKRFDGQWHPDSSGYIVNQRQDGQARAVFYDVHTGQPGSAPEIQATPPLQSPDGSRVLEYRGRQLYWREIPEGEPQRIIQPTKNREVYFRNPTWSPDGRRVLFIESDETDVKKRTMLVPSDPSYPTVREQRFARVGESITKL